MATSTATTYNPLILLQGNSTLGEDPIDVLDARVRSNLTALQEHVAGLVQRYSAATIASLTGSAYLTEAIDAL